MSNCNAVLTKLTTIYHNVLFGEYGSRPLKYLMEKRQLSRKTLRHFKIGYSFENVGYWLGKQFFSKEELMDSDMFYDNYLADHLTDVFDKLITIPVMKNGSTINFTGRYVNSDWIAAQALAPHKHRSGGFYCAYNEDCLKDSHYVIIVESPIDTMTLWQNSLDAIATFGINGLNGETALQLRNKRIYICYDRDSNGSGQRGAKRLGDMLGRLSIDSYIMKLPQGKEKMDVNSFFSKYDRDDFIEIMKDTPLYYPEIKEQAKYSEREGVEIERIIRKYFKKPKSVNRGYMVPCPYHNEKKPSLHAYTDTNEFYCYGCGHAGKALQLLIQLELQHGHAIGYQDAFKLYNTL